MPLTSRDHELIGRYLDGSPPEALVAELDARLRQDAQVAEALADVARMDFWLTERFRAEKDAGHAQAVIRMVETGRAPARRSRAADLWRRPAVRWAAVAATLVLACGVGLWLYVGGHDGRQEVLEGRVTTGGAPATRIADGAKITVASAGPAVIRLADGSRATFDAASEAVLRGRGEPKRPAVELITGGGTFLVAKQRQGFQVATALGRVTALGTEFTVRLVHAADRRPDVPRGAGHAALDVAVRTGTVEVEFGGKTHTLREGASRTFTREAERKAKDVRYSGEVVAAGEATVTLRIRKDEGKGVESHTLKITADTRILVETNEMISTPGEGGKTTQKLRVVEGAAADLRVGRRVVVNCAEDGVMALKVLVQRVPPKSDREREGEGKPPVPAAPGPPR